MKVIVELDKSNSDHVNNRRKRKSFLTRRKCSSSFYFILFIAISLSYFGSFVTIRKADHVLSGWMLDGREKEDRFFFLPTTSSSLSLSSSLYATNRNATLLQKDIDEFKEPQQKQQQQDSYSPPSTNDNLTFPQLDLDFPYVIINATRSSSTRMSRNTHATNEDEDEEEVKTEVPNICFIKCAYGSSIEQLDKADDKQNGVVNLQNENPNFKFYYFTNLEELNPASGWDKIIMKVMPYKRFITQSRYGKFMAWQLPEIQNNCAVVFYLDGQVRINQSITSSEWTKLAITVRDSPFGLLQVQHRNDMYQEKRGIIQKKKDLPSNMKITMKWIEDQLDDDHKEQVMKKKIYKNIYFGYDPTNPYYQSLSLNFWKQYSLEQGSWRDQILWAYTLSKLNIEPTLFGPPDLPFGADHYFVKMKHLEGYGSHTYSAKNDADAISQ